MVKNKTEFESIPTGTEKVLVVDDEERSVSIMKTILERLGYNVTAMTSSLKALELFKQNPARYDLLLTDLIMPQLTGDKLASEVLKIRPDISVILTSGFTDSIVNDIFKQASKAVFIPKPFQPKELAKTVRQVLDRPMSHKRDL